MPDNGPFWTVVFAYVVEYQFMFALGMLIAEWRRNSSFGLGGVATATALAVATVLLLGARAALGFSARPAYLVEASRPARS